MMEDLEWKYSKQEDIPEWIAPEEGHQYLVIQRAECDESDVYTLYLQSLTNGSEFRLRYWLTSADDNGNIVPNKKTRGTLLSLKKALYGPDKIGIPNPKCIAGCVVLAEVKLKEPNSKGVQYPAVYSFKPVPGDIAASYGVEGQYYEDPLE